MKNKSWPFCSIIVLNYYGEKVIQDTINSLLSINYPKDCYEIIIIDNNSKDRSKELIIQYQKNNKNIRAKFLEKNCGFAKGNNEGIKISKGRYVALLNNDCVVDKNWLRELVIVAEKNEQIAAVNSKIVLYPMYFKIEIKMDKNLIPNNIFLIDSYLCRFNNNKPIVLNGIDDSKNSIFECVFDQTRDKIIKIQISFNITRELDLLKVRSIELLNFNKEGYSVKCLYKDRNSVDCNITIDLKKAKVKGYKKVQNAGIMVFQDGAGRDIGASISYHKQNYERDCGQFSSEKEVYGACGAAVLYNKKILDSIGYLDELFFMYYEDVEISERARLAGYKIVFCPKAIVRHLHAFSSIEWSNFFIYHAEKGRLLHTFFHLPFKIFIKEFIFIIGRTVEVTITMIIALTDINKSKKYLTEIIWTILKKPGKEAKQRKDLGKAAQYFKIIIFFLIYLPLLCLKRRKKHAVFSKNALEINYAEILSGRWYFH